MNGGGGGEGTEALLRELRTVLDGVGTALLPPTTSLLRSWVAFTYTLFGAAACSLAVVDEQAGELLYLVAEGPGASATEGRRMPVGRGIGGWAVTTGQPVEVGDARGDPRFAADVAEETGYVPTRLLALPLEGPLGTRGLLTVLDADPTAALDATTVDRLTTAVGAVLDHVLVGEQLGRRALRAVAAASDSDDLTTMLERAAATGAPDPDWLPVAHAVARLANAGEEERALATDLLHRVATFVGGRP